MMSSLTNNTPMLLLNLDDFRVQFQSFQKFPILMGETVTQDLRSEKTHAPIVVFGLVTTVIGGKLGFD